MVFGDRVRRISPGALLDEIAELWAEVRGAQIADALDWHARVSELLIECGGLAQGVLDRAFHERGRDEGSEEGDSCLALVDAAARLLVASDFGGYDVLFGARGDEVEAPLAAARARRWDGDIEVKLAEGFAFYALYPESYARAAIPLIGEREGLQVIGIRSIGVTLGAVVRAASRARRPLLTVRPAGHPFARELRLGDDIAASLVEAGSYAVVDEGPGMSGSSFGAVGDWLEARGVEAGRIHFFPSHGGDLGPQASARHRSRWARVRRHVHEFDPRSFWGGAGEDIGGGQWRAKLYGDERAWPPCHLQQERRKYLVSANGGGASLIKFVGLGRAGRLAERRARTLAAHGFGPPVDRLRYGFLSGEWLSDAHPVDPGSYNDRPRLIARVADYLGFVATAFGDARSDEGEGPEALLAGARYNAQLLLGKAIGWRFTPWISMIDSLSREHRPVRTDNRMHAWEWIRLPDGRLLKTDGLDHHAAHDRIGCQDIAWDVAGASVELGLDGEERAELAARVAARTGALSTEKLRFYEMAYLGFQIGYWHFAAASAGGDETARCTTARDRYARALVALLDIV